MKRNCIYFLLLFISINYVQGQTADFSYDPTPSTRCAPIQVQCSDLSTGATSWLWTVTGPVSVPPSTNQFPSFTFIEPGEYTIDLSINGGFDNHTETITAFAGPDAQFGLAPGYEATGCAPFEVCFQDLSIPGDTSIVDWLWDLGIPTIDTVSGPCIIYEDALEYDIELVVTDANGCMDYTSEESYIDVFGGGFDFVGLPTVVAHCPPMRVEFYLLPPADTSSFDRITWYLELGSDFGYSGATAEGVTNPQHIYLASGPDIGITSDGYYDVALSIEHNGCTDSIYKDNYIYVGGQRGTFTFEPDSVCVGDTVTFYQVNLDRTDSIYWDFGNGDSYHNWAVYHGFQPVDSLEVVYDSAGIFEPFILLEAPDCPSILVESSVPLVVMACDADTTVLGVEGLDPLMRSVSVSPNPATQTAWLTINDFQETTYFISLMDARGQVLRQIYSSTSGEGTPIERNGLPAGIYILQISALSDPLSVGNVRLIFD